MASTLLDWMFRVGIVSIMTMFGMTLLGAWLVFVTRRSKQFNEDEEDALDSEFSGLNGRSPISMLNTTQSVLWSSVRKKSSRTKRPSFETRRRGHFEMIQKEDDEANENDERGVDGEDYFDEEERDGRECEDDELGHESREIEMTPMGNVRSPVAAGRNDEAELKEPIVVDEEDT